MAETSLISINGQENCVPPACTALSDMRLIVMPRSYLTDALERIVAGRTNVTDLGMHASVELVPESLGANLAVAA